MPRFAIATASSRPNNEDRAVVIPADEGWVVVVADGTGGMSGGGRAADLVVEGVRRSVQRGIALLDEGAWVGLLSDVDHEIENDASAGESTAVVLAVLSGVVMGASCGDSRAFLFGPSERTELTAHQQRKPRLGTGRAIPTPFLAPARGILVAGTDGLFDYALVDDISRAVLAAPLGDTNALVELVLTRHRTPPDDIAIVVGWVEI